MTPSTGHRHRNGWSRPAYGRSRSFAGRPCSLLKTPGRLGYAFRGGRSFFQVNNRSWDEYTRGLSCSKEGTDGDLRDIHEVGWKGGNILKDQNAFNRNDFQAIRNSYRDLRLADCRSKGEKKYKNHYFFIDLFIENAVTISESYFGESRLHAVRPLNGPSQDRAYFFAVEWISPRIPSIGVIVMIV